MCSQSRVSFIYQKGRELNSKQNVKDLVQLNVHELFNKVTRVT